MNTVWLVVIILGVSFQNVLKKAFNEKVGGGGVYFFSVLSSLAAMLFFVFTSHKLSFHAAVLPYAIGFGASYAIASVFGILAFSCGSLSLSTLMISYSLMLPSLYGLLFLKEPIGRGLLPGIVLLMISLFMINKKDEKVTISPKWLFYILLSFTGNGLCSIVQRVQQIHFHYEYKNEFMIMALTFVMVSLGVVSLLTEAKQMTVYVKKGWHLGIVCGVMNGIVNLLVMVLSASMPASLMFPLITSGGIVVTYLISKFFYREYLSRRQLIGFVFGVLSVILLSI